MKSYLIAITALLGISALHGMDANRTASCFTAANQVYATIPCEPHNRKMCADFCNERNRVARKLLDSQPWSRSLSLLAQCESDLLNPETFEDFTGPQDIGDHIHYSFAKYLAKIAQSQSTSIDDTVGYLQLSSEFATALLTKLNRTLISSRPNSPLRRS